MGSKVRNGEEFAWMVRSDGVRFPVEWHVYGNEEVLREKQPLDYEDLQETVDLSIWLYEHTRFPSTKHTCIRFLSYWLKLAFEEPVSDVTLDKLMDGLKNGFIYKGTTDWDFFLRHREEILSKPNSNITDESQSLARLANAELNQEFMRARIGGKYDSVPGNEDLYFRISSISFDWSDVIKGMVLDLKPTSVTICRDEESSGFGDCLLLNGEFCDKTTLEKILGASFSTAFGKKLAKGKNLLEALPFRNSVRRMQQYEYLLFSEGKLWQRVDSAESSKGIDQDENK